MNKRFTVYLYITLLFITAPFYSSSMSTPGTLDPSFTDESLGITPGLVVTNFDGGFDVAHALITQPDLKLVAAGSAVVGGTTNFALARYLPNGTLDPNFGTGGKVVTNFPLGADSTAFALILQTDGKLVAAGESNNNFALVRYFPHGGLDLNFGNNGIVTTDFNTGNDAAFALILQPDGKLVAAGQAEVTPGNLDFALARYLPNGTLDPDFGNGGKVTTPISGNGDIAFALILQPDGKLVAAGQQLEGGGSSNFALVRYLPNGLLDLNFGDQGKVITDFDGGDDIAHALILQPDGKFVAAGFVSAEGNNFGLARYLPNGSLDPDFGNGGKVITSFSAGVDIANALILQPDGKLVAAGISDSDFALARYLSNGTLDPNFGTGGKVTTDFNLGGIDEANSLSFQIQGTQLKLVAAGRAGEDFGLARYFLINNITPLASAVIAKYCFN